MFTRTRNTSDRKRPGIIGYRAMILASRRDPALCIKGYDNDDDGEGPRVHLQVEYAARSPRHFVDCIFTAPSSESTTRCREQWVWRAFGSRSTSRTTTRATRGEPEALGIEQPYLVVVFTKMICSKTTVDSIGVRRSWILEPGPRPRLESDEIERLYTLQHVSVLGLLVPIIGVPPSHPQR